jgi:hypothetical protein
MGRDLMHMTGTCTVNHRHKGVRRTYIHTLHTLHTLHTCGRNAIKALTSSS